MSRPHMLDLMPPLDEPRFEVKLGLPEVRRPEIMTWLTRRGFAKLYPARWVNSAYFDTDELDCLHAADAGISDRVKPRIRWYHQTLQPTEMRFEAKCKRGPAGYKYIALVQGPVDFRNNTWQQIRSIVQEQLDGPLSLLLRTASRPTACTRYRREYYVNPAADVRVTIDSHVELLPQWAMRPQWTRTAVVAPLLIVEVKAVVSLREKVSALLSDAPGRTSRLSKYGLALDPRRT